VAAAAHRRVHPSTIRARRRYTRNADLSADQARIARRRIVRGAAVIPSVLLKIVRRLPESVPIADLVPGIRGWWRDQTNSDTGITLFRS
jgi:hypothetical protein